jgi:Zn-dependent protease
MNLDIRLPIGGLFTLLGLLLVGYGLMSDPAVYARSLGHNVNLYWGVVNLLPVLPFDGGHVLEHALGPKRARITAGISFLVGALVAVYFLTSGSVLGAFFFAHMKAGFFLPNGYEFVLTLFAIVTTFMITGASAYSVDAIIAGRRLATRRVGGVLRAS